MRVWLAAALTVILTNTAHADRYADCGQSDDLDRSIKACTEGLRFATVRWPSSRGC